MYNYNSNSNTNTNTNSNANSNNITYNDMIYNRQNIKTPNIEHIDRLFNPPRGYPIENNLPNNILNNFLKTKRYNDNFLMPGFEIYLGNGELVDASLITPIMLAGSAPVEQAMYNFWKMIFENNVKIIVSLTPWIENNKVKADPYFNSSINGSIRFNDVNVKTIANATDAFGKLLNIDFDSHHIKILKLELIKHSPSGVKSPQNVKTIYHIHYTGWPDMGVPSISDIYALLKVYSCLQNNLDQQSKTFVHCSAGVGRTGTFIILCKAINHINRDIKLNNVTRSSFINLHDIVVNCRSKRRGLVQTQQQMDFITKFLCVYLSKIIKNRDNNMLVSLRI